MKKIKGNAIATVQNKTSLKNEIGETISNWQDLMQIKGFLDYRSGEASLSVYNAKIEDSTHIFLCDYAELPNQNEIRVIIKSKIYEVLLIDNPMELKYHMEIYLKYVGV